MSVIPIKNSLSKKKKKKIYPKESNYFNLQLKQSHKAFPKDNHYILTTELLGKSLLTYLYTAKVLFMHASHFLTPNVKKLFTQGLRQYSVYIKNILK